MAERTDQPGDGDNPVDCDGSSMAEEKTLSTDTERPQIEDPKQRPPESRERSSVQQIFRSARRAFGFLIAAVSVLATLAGLAGHPLWPVEPDITLPPPGTAVPHYAWIDVANRSLIFDLDSVEITCLIDEVRYGSLMKVIANAYLISKNQTIKANSTRPFRCNWDGAIYAPPDALTYAEIRVTFEYDRAFLGPSKYVVFGPFWWDRSVQPPRWIEGLPLASP